MPPTFYDPNSVEEQEVSLPSAPLVRLSSNAVLQPPLTRRGTGPGIILFLPLINGSPRTLDPEPVQKWAEEGFAVVGVTTGSGGWSVEDGLKKGVDALLSFEELDTRDKFGVLVYDTQILPEIVSQITQDTRLCCLISINLPTPPPIPTLVHLTADSPPFPPTQPLLTTHKYTSTSPHFILPHSSEYIPGDAALAHSRSLVFLRKHLGGPYFDIEAIWDEHTYFEFEVRSVAKTMGTMVAEPYVNHVPTMTGGIGRENLTAFYRDHFIFANPTDTTLQLVSRTVGSDRIVDEFIFKLTHDKFVDWLLPGVPPTGRKLEIPMMGVVNVRGDRLYHEHIWWDQATVLLQAGIIPTHVPHSTDKILRLPIASVESARLLVNEMDGKSNQMFGEDWGVKQS